jgi:hypothetical protein
MKNVTVTFEFIKEKEEWPICIAKIGDTTFICLEYLPYRSSYVGYCQKFLEAFLFGHDYSIEWQEVKPKTRIKRASHMRGKEKVRGLLAIEDLPF